MERENVIPLQASSRQEESLEKGFRPIVVENGGSEKQTAEVFENLVWLSAEEAASYLRKSVGAIRVLVCRGHLRARKFRRRLYFRRSELDRLIEGSERKGDFNYGS